MIKFIRIIPYNKRTHEIFFLNKMKNNEIHSTTYIMAINISESALKIEKKKKIMINKN